MASPNALKRSSEEAGLDVTATGQHGIVDFTSSQLPRAEPGSYQEDDSGALAARSSRASSLTASNTDSLLREVSIPPTAPNQPATSPPKRRKLTFAEKESKRLEKEAKDLKKAQEKAKKDEEKRLKDEEAKEQKRKKEEEKDERRKIREAEKQVKEEERKRKEAERKAREEEKTKKDKAQLRLGTFFTMPVPTNTSIRSATSSRRSSLCSVDEMELVERTCSRSATPQMLHLSDYERNFPSFFIHSYTNLAPYNRLSSGEGFKDASEKIDQESRLDREEHDSSPTCSGVSELCELVHLPPKKRYRKARQSLPVRTIIARINGTADHPIDLTNSKLQQNPPGPTDLLKGVSTKYLKFSEDVRPPYIGTYSKVPPGNTFSRLCRNPFTRRLPAIDYDYDSEAEWEEPGEGEDLDSEGEEDLGDEEDADDLDGFLDDEDAGGSTTNKRRLIMGDLQPVYTDLLWEGPRQAGKASVIDFGLSSLDLESFRMEVILDTPQTLIDPYSTSYWPSPHIANPQLSTMDPPRIPLHAITGTTNTLSLLAPSLKPSLPSKAPTPKRMVPADMLSAFKQAVSGSELTKAGLVEVLKKQFPTVPKDAIKDTLGVVAERVGGKEAEKRWVVNK